MNRDDIMRMAKQAGFTEVVETGTWINDFGMSMRDQFAAKAMQAILGWEGVQPLIKDHEAMDRIARAAYGWADAMLKARGEQ